MFKNKNLDIKIKEYSKISKCKIYWIKNWQFFITYRSYKMDNLKHDVTLG